ncbi:MAG: hypothetical protein ABIU95_14580 [Burkholderiales bacterium]
MSSTAVGSSAPVAQIPSPTPTASPTPTPTPTPVPAPTGDAITRQSALLGVANQALKDNPPASGTCYAEHGFTRSSQSKLYPRFTGTVRRSPRHQRETAYRAT